MQALVSDPVLVEGRERDDLILLLPVLYHRISEEDDWNFFLENMY